MLQFEPAQYQELLRAQMAEFEKTLCDQLITRSPETFRGLSRQDVRRFVAAGLAAGRAHGFRWQSTLASFVFLRAEICPRFDETPEIAEKLQAIRHAGECRLQVLLEDLPDAAWERAVAPDRGAAARAFLAALPA
jgi:hypothetical protein